MVGSHSFQCFHVRVEELRGYLVDGMAHWENQTCIKFVNRSRSHEDFVVFTSESCGLVTLNTWKMF